VKVDSVHRDDKHRFSKPAVPEVRLIEGIAVAGDAHAGATVQHLHLVRRNAAAPNLRQVHLIQRELIDELNAKGYDVAQATSARTSPPTAWTCSACPPARSSG
jgi:hypothetical protein